MKKFFALALVVCVGVAATPATSQAVPVGLELALLVDVSGSVDSNEFALQRDGYVNAFNSAAVRTAIANTPGGVAVTFVYWSGANQQSQVGNQWFHLTDNASIDAFANLIATTLRPFSGLTAPGSAINFTTPLFSGNGFEGARLVIDVSGDGEQNDGANTANARDNALANGINTINGLPIGGGAFLEQWYIDNIQGGTGSFVLAADSFEDFQAAIEEKLFREIITQVPEPVSMAVFGVGALVAGGLYRRSRKNLAA